MAVIDRVLERLQLRSTVFARMTLRGDWGFAKDALAGAPFHLVLSGRAHVRPQAGPTLPLGAGDIAILPRGEPHDLVGRPDAATIPWRRMMEQHRWEPWRSDTRFKAVDLCHGSGEPATRLISGVFSFDDDRPNPLLGALPPVMTVRAGDGSAASRAVAAVAPLLDDEIGSGQPGAENVATRLADILFVQAIRQQIASAAALPKGWLRGIADPELAPAIALIHREPGKPWSVAALASAVAMSRSRFAVRFRETVGQAPLEYLTDWRMFQAAGQLASATTALPTIAASIGYRSDVAFGKAFRRWAGQSPAAYRRSLIQRPIDGEEPDRPSAPDGAAGDDRLAILDGPGRAPT